GATVCHRKRLSSPRRRLADPLSIRHGPGHDGPPTVGPGPRQAPRAFPPPFGRNAPPATPCSGTTSQPRSALGVSRGSFRSLTVIALSTSLSRSAKVI